MQQLISYYDDYIIPNKALANKEIDANYFQHTPFLNNWNKKNNGTLVSAGNIHLEPIGVYSKKYKSLKDLPKGATVNVSSNVSDYGRILTIFKDAGLITLKKGTNIETANFNDIATNKKHLKFKHSFEAKLMPRLYKEGKDAAYDNMFAPYANYIAVRKADKNKPAIKKLVKALESKDTQNWIKKEFKGGVLPAN